MTAAEPRSWSYRAGTPPPECPHGTSYAQPCYSCGWVCPTCKRSYAPWVRECSYRHEDDWRERMGVVPGTEFNIAPPSFATQVSFRFPPEWSQPGHEHLVRAGSEWADILPGIQCRLGGLVAAGPGWEPGFDEAIVHFRLTPGPGSDDPA